MYEQMNNEALSGLVRVEQKRPKSSKWLFGKNKKADFCFMKVIDYNCIVNSFHF